MFIVLRGPIDLKHEATTTNLRRDLSHKLVSSCLEGGLGHLLRHHHGPVVFRIDSFKVAFSHAILLITVKTRTSLDIIDALVEADGCSADLTARLEVGSIVVVVLLLDFDVEHLADLEGLGPLAEETVTVHFQGVVQHCVLIVLHVELQWLVGLTGRFIMLHL